MVFFNAVVVVVDDDDVFVALPMSSSLSSFLPPSMSSLKCVCHLCRCHLCHSRHFRRRHLCSRICYRRRLCRLYHRRWRRCLCRLCRRRFCRRHRRLHLQPLSPHPMLSVRRLRPLSPAVNPLGGGGDSGDKAVVNLAPAMMDGRILQAPARPRSPAGRHCPRPRSRVGRWLEPGAGWTVGGRTTPWAPSVAGEMTAP